MSHDTTAHNTTEVHCIAIANAGNRLMFADISLGNYAALGDDLAFAIYNQWRIQGGPRGLCPRESFKGGPYMRKGALRGLRMGLGA